MLTPDERELILCMCRNDLNLSKTARELNYHVNTIRYKVERIKDKTEYSPATFYGALKLLGEIYADNQQVR